MIGTAQTIWDSHLSGIIEMKGAYVNIWLYLKSIGKIHTSKAKKIARPTLPKHSTEIWTKKAIC